MQPLLVIFLFSLNFWFDTKKQFSAQVPKLFMNQSLESKYKWILHKWHEAYKSGNYTSNDDIATKVFGKPSLSRKFRNSHSYPLLTLTTLQAYVDWNFVGVQNNQPILISGQFGFNFI